MEFIRKYRRLAVLAFFTAVTGSIGFLLFSDRHGDLVVAFLDIGQGDAIYIRSPTGTEIIVDGGPDDSLVRALSKLMPFQDHAIDAIINTNPDKDHYAGFFDLLDRYSVGAFFLSGTHSKTSTYAALLQKADAHEVPLGLAKRGMVFELGGGASLYVLFPDRDVSTWSSNEGSLVMKLVYGKTAVFLTGDSPQNIEKYLVQKEGAALGEANEHGETILKAGHHGSRTATSPELVAALHPAYAVISAGKKNDYGHPHKETLDTLTAARVPFMVTAVEGTIIFHSDGIHFSQEK